MAKQWKGPAKSFIDAMKTSFIGQGANPNDIFVQDLFNFVPPQGEGNGIQGLLHGKGLDEVRSLSNEDRAIIQSILSVYNEHISTKREVLTQARNLFDTDIIQTVIDVMIDDGFNSFNNEKEEFKIEYILEDDDLNVLGESYQQQVQNEIDSFVEKFALKTKVAEIVPELLRDGEYAFGVLFDKNNKKGITEIVDDLDVINLLPFYESEKLAFVINQNHFDDNNSKLNFVSNWNSMMDESKPIAYKPDNIVFFRLKGPTKLRINMSTFYDSEFRKAFKLKTGVKLPKYIRTSLPIYYNAMKTLNRLKIMENVSTVLDLVDILKPEIVHVSVPTNTSATEAQQIIRDYERQLNESTGFSVDDSWDISSLTAQANRRKVLPVWLDNKGSLNSAGINQAGKGANAWDSIDKLRNLAALSIGIPPFYINISGTPIEKAQIIKLYSRYTRKLTSLQKTLADGIKDFLMIHLRHKGLNVSRDNLSVKFKAITSGDSLDDTDLMCSVITSIGDLYKALDEITASENNNLVLDNEQFKELFNDLTSRYLNISNLIKLDENKFANMDGEEGGFEPIGSPSHERSSGGGSSGGSSVDININDNTGGGFDAESSYDSFVDAGNDIGVENITPATEEI